MGTVSGGGGPAGGPGHGRGQGRPDHEQGFCRLRHLGHELHLGLAVQKVAGWDLILCGKEAMDGMTAQVGPELAEYPPDPSADLCPVSRNHGGRAQIRQKLGKVQRILEAPLPVLVTVEREMNEPRIAPWTPSWRPMRGDPRLDPGGDGRGCRPLRTGGISHPVEKVFSRRC